MCWRTLGAVAAMNQTAVSQVAGAICGDRGARNQCRGAGGARRAVCAVGEASNGRILATSTRGALKVAYLLLVQTRFARNATLRRIRHVGCLLGAGVARETHTIST